MSKSPLKKTVQDILSEAPHVQDFPDGKLIYVVADKESNTGMFNNERLLVFNSKDKTIGYSNVIPKKIPVSSIEEIRYIKKKAPVADVEITKRKDKLKCLEIKCKEFSYRNAKN